MKDVKNLIWYIITYKRGYLTLTPRVFLIYIAPSSNQLDVRVEICDDNDEEQRRKRRWTREGEPYEYNLIYYFNSFSSWAHQTKTSWTPFSYTSLSRISGLSVDVPKSVSRNRWALPALENKTQKNNSVVNGIYIEDERFGS